MTWLISALFALSVSGLAFVLMKALQAGAETYSGTYSEDTARQFEDIFVFIPPRRIAEAGWACGGAAFLAVFLLVGSVASLRAFLLGLMLAAAAGALALRVPRQLLAILRRRRLHRFNTQLVDTLVNMSNALKAGFSIMQACESVVRNRDVPISQEFEVLLQQTRVGVGFSDALHNMEERVGSDDLTLVVSAIETARKTGGNLTEIFDKIAATIRERMRIENRIRTLTAQGRLQGIIVSAMPAVIGVAMLILDPGMMLPFLHSVAGVAVITVVLALITLGGLMIRKIVKIDV
jgi:tight adherence protein B